MPSGEASIVQPRPQYDRRTELSAAALRHRGRFAVEWGRRRCWVTAFGTTTGSTVTRPRSGSSATALGGLAQPHPAVETISTLETFGESARVGPRVSHESELCGVRSLGTVASIVYVAAPPTIRGVAKQLRR